MKTFVIVGANLAGGRAAIALREEGFEGRIVMVGKEAERPYERPPLSKEFLRGELDEKKLFLNPADYYQQHEIELRCGVKATRLDVKAHEVELNSHDRIAFDRLLIATGTSPRHLKTAGNDLGGIYYLRTIEDAKRIRLEMASGKRVVIVGAGFIGAEVAASCRQKGVEVTMLEMAPVPLRHALGAEIGRVYTEIHREKGVDLRTGESVQSIRGEDRVQEVVTISGNTIPCDFVVVGVGVVPETSWLTGSGLQIDNGVVVNEFCETNVSGIFAAGDVANWWSPAFKERIRVEHFDNAQNQGIAAAQNMLGKQVPYDPVPFFWSDQYDLRLHYVGHANHWDQLVLRGSVGSRSFTAFYLIGSQVRAALVMNRFKDLAAARQLIQAQISVTPGQLGDEKIELKSLLR